MAGKAANGEGTVFKRSRDGRWVYQWSESGRRRSLVFRTRREARDAQREIVDRLSGGQAALDSRAPLETWAAHWVADILPVSVTRGGKRLSEATVKTYTAAMRAQIIPALGDTPLGELTPGKVQTFVLRLARDRSPAYAGISHRALTRCLEDARKDRLIAVNPCREVAIPRGKSTVRPIPKPADVRALIEGSPTPLLRAFNATLGYTGCRISEALDLHWSGIDFDAAQIQLHGKGSKDRTIPMVPTLADELRRWRAAQRAERLAAEWWADGDLVLTTPHGTRWDNNNLRREWRPAVAAVLPDLVGMTPHSLRHALATMLLEEGVELKLISLILGHSSIAVTSAVYIHANVEMLRPAATAAAAAIERGRKGA